MINSKHTLREQARQHREASDFRGEDIEAATPLFFDAIAPRADQVIAMYWPTEREFDPTHILEQALGRGLICALPRVEKNSKILQFVEYTANTRLEKGAFGIMEPVGDAIVLPDIVLCPLLAFDRAGYRLGQGGGYYDATLEHLRAQKEVIALGVGYAGQAVLFHLPREAHDQKMDYILTPQGITDYRD